MVTTEEVERLMKRCQAGVGGRDALNVAHGILAECYGTLGALVQQRDELLLRQPGGSASSRQEPKVVRRGQLITMKDYGLVKFQRLDHYLGQVTARLIGIDHPGTYYPFLDVIEKEGFTIIDE